MQHEATDVEKDAAKLSPATGEGEAGAHQRRRDRRLLIAVGTSALVRPLAVLIPVLVIPVFVRYLGTTGYGIYEAISSLAVWIGLTNAGLGFGLLNRLMDCNVSGDRELARSYTSTLFAAMLVLLVVGTIAISVLAFLVDWSALFNAVHLVDPTELRWAVWFAMFLPLLGVAFSMAPAVYSAYQEIHRQNVWEGVAKVGTIAACLAVPAVGFGIPGAVVAMAGTPVVVSIVNHFHLWYFRKPWLRPNPRLFRLEHLRRLLGEGFILFLLTISVAIMFQIDRLVIGLLRSPEEVASYAVAQRAFMLAYGVFMLILSPLWPAYGEAIRRRDVEWCRRKLRISTLSGVTIMLLAGLVFLLFRRVLLDFVGDETIDIGLPLIAAMTTATVFRTWSDSHAILLNGANVLKPQLLLLTTCAAFTLILSLIFTHFFGIVGTAWAYPLSAGVTTLWVYPWLVRRYVLKLS